MLRFTYSDISDCESRINYLQIRLESLRRLGVGIEMVEAELAKAHDTLNHLEHHRKILEFVLRTGVGSRHMASGKPI